MTNSSFDKEKIIARIEDIKNALLELAKIPCSTTEEFQKDRNNFYLSCYWLRIAIEAVLTIAFIFFPACRLTARKKITRKLLCRLLTIMCFH